MTVDLRHTWREGVNKDEFGWVSEPCNDILVTWTHELVPGESLRAEDALWPKVKNGDSIQCGSCGASFFFLHSAFAVFEPHSHVRYEDGKCRAGCDD